MANAKTKSGSKKRAAVKDLKPRNARTVKGGDTAKTTTRTDFSNLTIMKVVDKASVN